MLLWAILYMALVACVGIAAVAHDVRSGASRVYVACNLVATGGLLVMVLAYWNRPTAAWLGRGALPLVLLVLAWEVYGNAKNQPTAPSISERQEWLWVVLTAIFYAPAFAAGIAICLRAW